MTRKKVKEWLDAELAQLLADKIVEQFPRFPGEAFVIEVKQAVDPLEFKARLSVFSENLKKFLPEDYGEATAILVAILGEENPAETGMFTEFYWVMPIATFVEEHGVSHFDQSVAAIAEITKRNTGEFAIRPFLRRYPKQTLDIMLKWSLDDNFHLRRLASEGTRPRLPWATKLDLFIDDPHLVLPILTNLKNDPVKFVQTSVANHLNDILKDNYDFGMAILREWIEDAPKERRWIINHALRKQVKDGNPEAIRLRHQIA